MLRWLRYAAVSLDWSLQILVGSWPEKGFEEQTKKCTWPNTTIQATIATLVPRNILLWRFLHEITYHFGLSPIWIDENLILYKCGGEYKWKCFIIIYFFVDVTASSADVKYWFLFGSVFRGGWRHKQYIAEFIPEEHHVCLPCLLFACFCLFVYLFVSTQAQGTRRDLKRQLPLLDTIRFRS